MQGGTSECWSEIGVSGAATCEKLATVAHCRNCPEYARAARRLLDREIPNGLSEEWALTLTEPKQTSKSGLVSVVVFQIRDEWLALKTVLLQEVVEARAIHAVPFRTNRIFRGLVNVSGELLLCFSAGHGLGIAADKPGPEPGLERMFVVNIGGERFVFPVDDVLGVRSFSPNELETAPVTVAKHPGAVTTAVFFIDGRRAGLLDGEKFAQAMMRSLEV